MSSCHHEEDRRAVICESPSLNVLDRLPANGMPPNINTLIILHRDVGATSGATSTHTLQPAVFASLTNLQNLSINNYRVPLLTEATFKDLPMLTSLDLASNSIEHISNRTFSGLSKLVSLDLSHNLIATIKPEYFDLPNLKDLSLANNKLTSLPDGSFAQLPLLQVLTLDGNDLRAMRSGNVFRNLDHLHELNMRSCNQDFPHVIFHHIQNIESLDLSMNNLDKVPTDSIKHLYFLQKLVITGNRITYLPDQSFQGLALQKLDLSNNSIDSIVDTAFRNFRTEQLYLGYNRLQEVPYKALALLSRNLFILDLSGNDLSKGPFILPSDLVYLQKLNLSNTGLQEVPINIHSLFQLQELDLRHNHILRLNRTVLKVLLRLQASYLENNPWWCDCSIMATKDWLSNQHHLPAVCGTNSSKENANASCLVCRYPDSHRGQPIVELSEDQFKTCGFGVTHAGPIFVYVICALIVLFIIGMLIFFWYKHNDKLPYGRFCGDKALGTASHHDIPVSPIKVITNAGAGANELPRATDEQGPVKNQAWESALVITNPHNHTNSQTQSSQQEHGFNSPGAETVV